MKHLRTLALLSVCCLMTIALVGCKGSTEDTDTTTTTPEDAPDVDPAGTQPMDIE